MKTPYPKTQALKLIKKAIKSGALTYPTKHFKKRLRERKVDSQDVLYILNNGKILKEPELDINTNEWKYVVEGKTLSEEYLNIPVLIYESENKIKLLTVMN